MTAAEVRALIDSYGVSPEWADAFEAAGGCEALVLMEHGPTVIWEANDEGHPYLVEVSRYARLSIQDDWGQRITVTNHTAAALACRMVVAQCGLGLGDPLATKVVELERRNEVLQQYLDNARTMKTLPVQP